MTRQHFEAIAAIIKRHKQQPMTPEELADEFAALCRAYNGHFDHQRFLTACGL